MRVGILGASGLIGGYLRSALEERGDEVVTASLRDPARAASATTSCDVVVNLAGEPIAQRWSAVTKHRLRESRIEAPKRFLEALATYPQRPRAYISASAIGYYGTSETQTFDESSPAGADFLARLCQAWEEQAHSASALRMRVGIVRTGIVLARDGGMLAKMLPAFRAGFGGKIGSGRQWISWIHIADTIEIYLAAIDGLEGPLNATAPQPVTNADFTQALARILKRPAFATVPAIALQAMFGEGAAVIGTGQRVLPRRLESMGFSFAYPLLTDALEALFARHPELT